MIALGAGVIGALIGSFLNVVIYRVPRSMSVVRPASSCPACAVDIRPVDNIPVVSWLLLRGRCRHCAAPISARYPLVELGTALAFAGVALLLGPAILSANDVAAAISSSLTLLAFLYLAAISIALAAIDLDSHRLPNSIVLPAFAVAGVMLGAAALLSGDVVSIARAAAGAGVLFTVYLVLALIAPRGMGMGDVKLAGVLGLYLGWIGWGALAVGSLGAFVLGGVVGMALIVLRRASRSTAIPFGPWMLAGAWIGIVFGEWIAVSYLALFGMN